MGKTFRKEKTNFVNRKNTRKERRDDALNMYRLETALDYLEEYEVFNDMDTYEKDFGDLLDAVEEDRPIRH